jgi:hypothetical protein
MQNTIVYIYSTHKHAVHKHAVHKHAAAQDTSVQYTIGHISMQQLKTPGWGMEEYT